MEYIADDGVIHLIGRGEKMARIVVMDPGVLQRVSIAGGEPMARGLDAAGREFHRAALHVGERERARERDARADAEEQDAARPGRQQQGQPRLIGLHEHRRRIGRGVLPAHIGEQDPLPVGLLDHLGDGDGIFVAIQVAAAGHGLRQKVPDRWQHGHRPGGGHHQRRRGPGTARSAQDQSRQQQEHGGHAESAGASDERRQQHVGESAERRAKRIAGIEPRAIRVESRRQGGEPCAQ